MLVAGRAAKRRHKKVRCCVIEPSLHARRRFEEAAWGAARGGAGGAARKGLRT